MLPEFAGADFGLVAVLVVLVQLELAAQELLQELLLAAVESVIVRRPAAAAVARALHSYTRTHEP